ncbi:MAG: hypothetical protein KIT39_13640, partial [Nitrospirales bacterium]|nr:hypothetical protein [Nitrospirales bacterium]
TVMGNRHIVLTRELTKLNEEILRGETEEVVQQLKGKSLKGEITLLIQGLPQRSKRQLEPLTEHSSSTPITHLPSE